MRADPDNCAEPRSFPSKRRARRRVGTPPAPEPTRDLVRFSGSIGRANRRISARRRLRGAARRSPGNGTRQGLSRHRAPSQAAPGKGSRGPQCISGLFRLRSPSARCAPSAPLRGAGRLARATRPGGNHDRGGSESRPPRAHPGAAAFRPRFLGFAGSEPELSRGPLPSRGRRGLRCRSGGRTSL
jgi:hypothetical protein